MGSLSSDTRKERECLSLPLNWRGRLRRVVRGGEIVAPLKAKGQTGRTSCLSLLYEQISISEESYPLFTNR